MASTGFWIGWPALLAALLLALAGIYWRRPLPLWIGALLAAPVALYLSGTPMFRLGGLIPVAALTLAAITCTRQPRWHSMACVAVYAVFVAALAVIVFGAQ